MFNDYLHIIHDIACVYTDICFLYMYVVASPSLRAHLVYYLTRALLNALRGILENYCLTGILCVSSSISFQDVDDILK